MQEDSRRPLMKSMLKADLTRRELTYLVIAAVVCLALTLLASVPTSLLSKEIFTEGTLPLRVTLIILTVLAWLLDVTATLWLAYPSVELIILLQTDKFSIVTDKLLRIEEDEPASILSRSAGRTEDAFYFDTHGRVAVDGRLRDMSTEGEILYLAVLHGKRDRVIGVYHPSLYTTKV